MKNNELENSYTHNKEKHRKIISKKLLNSDSNVLNECNNNIFSNKNKLSNFNKYQLMSSSIFNQSNSKKNNALKKYNLKQNTNLNNTKRIKTINSKNNEKHNLFLPSKISNLKGTLSAYYSNTKSNKIKGTKLDISKSEIQYPLNYSKNDTNKYKSNTNKNSVLENVNKEIDLRISTKLINKNNKENIGKYNISSPSNKSNYSFGKKQRQSLQNSDTLINKGKKNESYSPDIINYSNDIRDIKSFKNNFYKKGDNNGINTFNIYKNLYQKDDFNSRKNNEINFNSSFNNTMNHYGFYNNKINNNKKEYNFLQLDNDINLENENDIKYYNNHIKYNNNKENICSSRYNNIENDEEIYNNQILKENNIKDFLSYQSNLIEEFCNNIEEFMFYNVKNNFNIFISKLKEIPKDKSYNSLLLKRIQNRTIKKKFYHNRDSSYENINQKSNKNNKDETYKKYIYPSNNISKEFIRRKTFNNFNNKFQFEIKPQEYKGNSYQRKSQEKILVKNFDSFYNNDSYDISFNTNNEHNVNNRKNSNEKYDTNLYIPKKYRHINNSTENKTNMRKYISYNYNKINPYFTNINKKKEIFKISYNETDNNINKDIEEDIIKTKIERSSNKKNKKNKNHNISCDNKHSMKYCLDNGILNEINKIKNKNPSVTMNFGQIKENENKPIYNKKKVKLSKPKSKIFLNKKNQDKIIKRNNNNLKGKHLLNLNIDKKINNKYKNDDEHYGIMTLSSNASENSNDLESIKDENEVYKIISPKIKNTTNTYYNKVNKKDIIYNIEEINFREDSKKNSKKELKNKKIKTNNENRNISKIIEENNDERKKNFQEIYNKEDVYNNSHIKMSNGKNDVNKVLENNEYYSIREIIVKDVSTRDKRVNVFIKYIEDPRFHLRDSYSINNEKNRNMHLLILIQTDSIYLPAIYDQKNNGYKNSKYYKNMNDKNHKNKMNKILSSIIEEEEKSKAAGSLNNSIISDEENLKNGNYSYFFIQSIKYFIGFLQSIFNDKKKSLYFSFFKVLKKIKNDSYLKGLMSQKKIQALNKAKNESENKDHKSNTSGDIVLYNINDKLDVDINYFNDVKNENQNPKNKIKDSNTTLDEKYSTDNFCLFIDENSFNKKENINLSMDNTYSNNKKNHKYNKNILNKIINNTEINKSNTKKKECPESNINGKEYINKNNENTEDKNSDYEKNITLSEAQRRISDIIYDFRIYLMKFGMKK